MLCFCSVVSSIRERALYRTFEVLPGQRRCGHRTPNGLTQNGKIIKGQEVTCMGYETLDLVRNIFGFIEPVGSLFESDRHSASKRGV
jgi:hypothetical protein